MGQQQVQVALVMVLAIAVAACGVGSPSAAPSKVTGAAPTAVPGPSGRATATITVEAGVEADGPGESISHALADADSRQQLVNGILLRAVDGSTWLCEAPPTSSPPQCSEPRLLVENGALEDSVFVDGDGLHEVDGVRWLENAQLFGTVRP